jgi:hypothetical protein
MLAEKQKELNTISEKQRDGQLAGLAKLKKTHEDFLLR